MTLSSPVDADQLRDSLLRFIEERVRLELLTAHNDTSPLAQSGTRLEISHRAPLWDSSGGGGGGTGEGQGQEGRQEGDGKRRGGAAAGVLRSAAPPPPSPAASATAPSINMSPARSSGAAPAASRTARRR